MDTFTSSPVAVTGASGYIASWIVKLLLERGATVHGTVRKVSDRAKVAHLEDLARAFPGKLRLFEADLLVPSSFDEAFRGCTAVVHAASPFMIQGVKDARSRIIRPALDGTRNVLASVNAAESVRRVVLTSSIAAMCGDAADKTGTPITEADWNTTSTESHQPYSYSKTVAERAAWDMANAQSRWSLAVMNPGFVIGPALSSRTEGTSTDLVLQMLDGRMRSGVPDFRFGMVDVRDVARAHVEAVAREGVGGRCILSAESSSFPELARLLRERYPGLKTAPRGTIPGPLLYILGPALGLTWRYLRRNVGIDLSFDNKKSREELGMRYAPIRSAFLEQVEQLRALSGIEPGPASGSEAKPVLRP